MKPLRSSMFNMVIVLTLLAAGIGALLGWVHDFTAGPIAESVASQRADALARVLSDPCLHPPGEAVEYPQYHSVLYPVEDCDGILVGVAVEVFTDEGFGGRISLMVGFEPSGLISGYSVLSHAETPGLGAKMDTWFRSLSGRDIIGTESPLAVRRDGGGIDAITGATITSRAFLGAVNDARRAFETYIKDNSSEI